MAIDWNSDSQPRESSVSSSDIGATALAKTWSEYGKQIDEIDKSLPDLQKAADAALLAYENAEDLPADKKRDWDLDHPGQPLPMTPAEARQRYIVAQNRLDAAQKRKASLISTRDKVLQDFREQSGMMTAEERRAFDDKSKASAAALKKMEMDTKIRGMDAEIRQLELEAARRNNDPATLKRLEDLKAAREKLATEKITLDNEATTLANEAAKTKNAFDKVANEYRLTQEQNAAELSGVNVDIAKQNLADAQQRARENIIPLTAEQMAANIASTKAGTAGTEASTEKTKVDTQAAREKMERDRMDKLGLLAEQLKADIIAKRITPEAARQMMLAESGYGTPLERKKQAESNAATILEAAMKYGMLSGSKGSYNPGYEPGGMLDKALGKAGIDFDAKPVGGQSVPAFAQSVGMPTDPSWGLPEYGFDEAGNFYSAAPPQPVAGPTYAPPMPGTPTVAMQPAAAPAPANGDVLDLRGLSPEEAARRYTAWETARRAGMNAGAPGPVPPGALEHALSGTAGQNTSDVWDNFPRGN